MKQQLDAALAKIGRLEKRLATLLAKEAASAALERHGAGHSKLLHAHVSAAIRARDVDADRPAFGVVDIETGEARPISVDDYVAELRRSPDFAACFEAPKGKGSKPAKVTLANPWRKGPTFNATQQSRLLRSNPALAAQLQEEAGVLVPPTQRF